VKRIACFKLAYALGVRAGLLELAFSTEYRVARFPNSSLADPLVVEFRQLSYLYNCCLRNFRDWSDSASFVARANKFVERNNGIEDIDAVKKLIASRGSSNFCTFINRLLDRREALLDAVYRILELGIVREIAYKLLSETAVNTSICRQRSWFLMMTSRETYGFCTGIEVLDYAQRLMFDSDSNLFNRLGMLSNSNVGFILQDSKFHQELQAYLDAGQLTPPRLSEWDNVYALTSKEGVIGPVLTKYKTYSEGNGIKLTPIVMTELRNDMEGKTLVITDTAAVVEGLAQKFPLVDFGILPPLESAQFLRWHNRVVPNVYIVQPYGDS